MPALLLAGLLSAGTALVGSGMAAAAEPQVSQVGYPTFKGSANPVPDVPAGYTSDNQMEAIFTADVAAGAGTDTDHDFWVDKMLTRTGTAGDSDPGNSDNNQYLFSRGRAVFMKTHDPSVLGFGGQVAYWEAIDGREAYDISLQVDGTKLKLTEDTSARKQTPSYWREKFTTSDSSLSVTEVKFITANDVAVTEFTVDNTGSADRTVAVKATSPYTTDVDGDELTGTVPALNNLTTIYPRFSGDGLTPSSGSLTGNLAVPAGGHTTTKVQLGFTTKEIPASRTEYDSVRAATPAAAYRTSVTAYNQWWADNIPYLDVPDKNIEKSLYYRWWLMRFNYLDANIPGNDYQFPTSVEGALGYNNAIDLTVPLFLDDLKYFRDPSYSYGTWVSAGEVQAPSGQYIDNPGDPANWSASHAQYISASALRSYELHGGPSSIAEQLAGYASKDVKGQLAVMDTNKDGVLDTNWNSWTGNDADAVSFDYAPGDNLDRPESAFTWAGAEAAVQAYTMSGDTAKAADMQTTADTMQTALLNNLWDPSTDSLLSKDIKTGKLDPWKEINNYDPYTVGEIPKPDGTAANDAYTQALRYFADQNEFPIFPFYTADQKDKAAATAAGRPGSNNFSFINSTGLLNLYASAIRNYPSSYVTADSYSKLLSWNAWANYADSGDNRYPDATEFFSDGSADPGSIGYRSWIHQTILGATNHNVIEDVMGLQSRTDDKVELWPIDIGWDHFDANNIAYRNTNLSITWDKPGDGKRYYGDDVPEGLSIWVNGKRVATVDSLTHFVYDPATGKVSFPGGGSATATYQTTSDVDAPTQVTFPDDSRVTDIFAKSGDDITASGAGLPNLAKGATATATYSASGHGPAGVVDGSTAINPYWGSSGSSHAQDSVELDLPSTQKISDLKAYFYSDKKIGGYAEPATYTVQYDDNGTWKPVTSQARTPVDPIANYNDIRFAEVTTGKIRITVTPQDGYSTGIKELQLFDPTSPVTAQQNTAPQVDAYVDTSSSPGEAHLTGVVKDDGQPSGTLSQQWSVVSAPDGGVAVISTPTDASTLVRFTKAGSYTLRLTATDGTLSTSDDVTVTPTAAAGGANVATSATPSADYTASWDSVNAVNDGKVLNSGGASTDYWGTWTGNDPTTRTLQYTWKSPVRISGSNITFWHDSPVGNGGGVVVPHAWKMQYLAGDGKTWTDVPDPSGYGTSATGSNATTFSPVTTTAVRAIFTADSNGKTNAAVGVSEWQVLADQPESVTDTQVRTTVGTVPTLPATVDVVYSDGSRTQSGVTWQAITPDQVAEDGASFTVTGIVGNAGAAAKATVWVRSALGDTITNLQPVTAHTVAGTAPQLPGTVTATYNDGTMDSSLPVSWGAISASSYAKAGTFTVHGTVPGTGFTATATVTVKGAGGETASAPEISTVSVADGNVVGGTVSFAVGLAGKASDISYTYIELNRGGVWTTDNTVKAAIALGSGNSGLDPKLVVDTTALPNGSYGLKIDAVGADGLTTEKKISFTVNNPPVVTFAAPASDATVKGTVAVRVGLSGQGLSAYNLRVDGTGLQYLYQPAAGTETFSLDTTTLSDGVHTLLATATDSAGNKTTVTEKITVRNT
ncbi:Ig-like domain-containing protein [Actinacidiphila yeochonensis]|uniref:Ig-like domain-containing protein n=1 Tax=Actinacidiphila yeochonensis TaxID=89050 RepID=UPI00068ECCA5|nr:Ig-like domain-containing protein [Actinacidiphila yeochonensis]